jgi:hypothetical protein
MTTGMTFAYEVWYRLTIAFQRANFKKYILRYSIETPTFHIKTADVTCPMRNTAEVTGSIRNTADIQVVSPSPSDCNPSQV